MEQTIASWSMVMVHGLMVAGPGIKSKSSQIVGSRVGVARRSLRIKKSNVVHVQAGYLARPTTKAPETRIYLITHGSGAFLVLRLRTVVRGERASRSIVAQCSLSLCMEGFRHVSGLSTMRMKAEMVKNRITHTATCFWHYRNCTMPVKSRGKNPQNE